MKIFLRNSVIAVALGLLALGAVPFSETTRATEAAPAAPAEGTPAQTDSQDDPDENADPAEPPARRYAPMSAEGNLTATRPTLTELPEVLLAAAKHTRVNPQGVVISIVPVGRPDRPVLAWRDAVPHKPASTAKLVTTLAALETLGASHRWYTGFYATSQPDRRGVLKGGLWIRGGGDPAFVVEDFALEIERLAALGVKRIEGNVTVDRSLFAVPAVDPGAFDGRASRPYNLPPDAALVNYRAITLEFTPDPAKGVANVVMLPPLAGVTVPKTIKLSRGGCGDWKTSIGFKLVKGPKDTKRVVLNGTLPARCGAKNFSVIALEADEYFERLFRELWERDGRKWTGHVVTGPVPENAERILLRMSPTLAEVTALTNKWSNNTMARQILLSLGVHRVGKAFEAERKAKAEAEKSAPAKKTAQKKTPEKKPLVFPPTATIEDARAELRDWMASRGIPADEITIDNGSGLSRETRVTGRAMTRLLAAGFSGPYMPEYLASLPITGKDGTMARRHYAPEEGRIKTGYLNDVRSIGGYIHAQNGERYAVYASVEGEKNVPNGIAFLNAVIDWVYWLD